MISVIMYAYNYEKFIEESIQSVLNQSYNDIELIVVNDKSTDNTGDILEILSKEDNRILCIEQDCHKGIAASRNLGLDFSSGDYIMFLDCDDVLSPDSLKILSDLSKSKNADLVIGTFYSVEGNGVVKCQEYEDRVFSKGEVSECIHMNSLLFNKLMKRNLLEKNNIYFPLLELGEDLCFYHMCLVNSERVVTTSSCVGKYREHKWVDSSVAPEDYINSFRVIEMFYNKSGNKGLVNMVIYDKLYYLVETIKKLPYNKSKKNRLEIFNIFVMELEKVKDCGNIDENIVRLVGKADYLVKRKWFYISKLGTYLLRCIGS